MLVLRGGSSWAGKHKPVGGKTLGQAEQREQDWGRFNRGAWGSRKRSGLHRLRMPFQTQGKAQSWKPEMPFPFCSLNLLCEC